jgi:CyaY protein
VDDSAFIAAAEATLDKIGLALDAALETSDADLDWSLNDGVLTIECEDGSRIIVNRHVPNRELWLATKGGGFHYRLDDGAFVNTRGGDAFGVELARALRTQAGADVALPALDGSL